MENIIKQITLDLKLNNKISNQLLEKIENEIVNLIIELKDLNKKEIEWIDERSLFILRVKYGIINDCNFEPASLGKYLKLSNCLVCNAIDYAKQQLYIRIINKLRVKERISSLQLSPNYEQYKNLPITVLGYKRKNLSYNNLISRGITNIEEYLKYSKEELKQFKALNPTYEHIILDKMKELDLKYLDELSFEEKEKLINENKTIIFNTTPHLISYFNEIEGYLRNHSIWIYDIKSLISYFKDKDFHEFKNHESLLFNELVSLGLFCSKNLNLISSIDINNQLKNNEIPLTCLNLPRQYIKKLIDNDILSVNDLLCYHPNQLLYKIKSFSLSTISELRIELHKYNLKFLDELTMEEKNNIINESDNDIILSSSPYWIPVEDKYMSSFIKKEIEPNLKQYLDYLLQNNCNLSDYVYELLNKINYEFPNIILDNVNIKEEYLNKSAEEILNCSVSNLFYNNRISLALIRNNILTVSDLLQYDIDKIPQLKSLGNKTTPIIINLFKYVNIRINQIKTNNIIIKKTK